MKNEHHALELLAALCAVDSRTAAGAAGTARVAARLAALLRELGFETELLPVGRGEHPEGRHLKAVRNPAAARRIMLVGHTDTVLSPAETPYRLDVEAGRVHGAGVCDMKGGCVVMLEGLRTALEKHAAVRDLGLTVMLNCAEEFSGPSFPEYLRTAGAGAAACLNFEPAAPGPAGRHQIVVGRKGVVRFELECRGRTAHAGNDHPLGVNAVRELARKIEQIEALTDYERATTANVGFVSGGLVPNQVAGEARAIFEVRACGHDELERMCAAVRAICSEATVRSAADGMPVHLRLQEHPSYPPWPRSADSDALGEKYVNLARNYGIDVEPVTRGGGADASHLAAMMPTLDGLGILGGGMHSSEEWADVSSMAARAGIFADLLADLARGAD